MNERIYTIAERIAEIEYLKRGYEVSSPSGAARYDFIAEKGGRCVKIQVKTGTPFNGGTELIAHSAQGYKRSEIDILVMVDMDRKKCYYIPADHIVGQTNIRLKIYPSLAKTKALNADHYEKFIG